MPTYEFRCEAGHTTDRFYRSMNAAPAVIECPTCGESAVRQVSGGIGLVFKGSGFYITDYGKDGKKPRTAEKSETPSVGSEGKTAGESKTQPTEGSKPAASKKTDGGPSSSGSDK